MLLDQATREREYRPVPRLAATMPHISSAIASRVPKRSAVCQSSVICVMVPRRARGSTSSRRPTRCAARDCWSTFTAATGRSSRRSTSRFSRQPGTRPDSPAQSSATRSHPRRAFRPSSPSVAKRSRGCMRRADVLDFDPRNMVVAGSSAGGYLAAACGDRSSIPLRGMVCVSGIYDVAPLIGTSINDALGLDAATAASLDLLNAGHQFCPAVVAWGEIETSEFKRQSRAFAARLSAAGTPSTVSRDTWTQSLRRDPRTGTAGVSAVLGGALPVRGRRSATDYVTAARMWKRSSRHSPDSSTCASRSTASQTSTKRV